jgi:putative intracellular protease/amidase
MSRSPFTCVLTLALVACAAGDGLPGPRAPAGSKEGEPANAAHDVPETVRTILHDVPADETEEGAPPSPVRVALYLAPGVGMDAHVATLAAFRAARNVVPTVVSPEQVRSGGLAGQHVVVFTGGRGGVQGEALGEDGRRIVREFVAGGGGYIGVCAGAYLALQGPDEFHKLAIVAGRNLSGDAWQRGVITAEVQEVGGERVLRLFYANGPVVEAIPHPVLPRYMPLALFRSDAYLPAHGTRSGEMPGTPAILAAAYGRGRIILFSPNPVLANEGEAAVPELMLQAVRWVSTPGPVRPDLVFSDVFR